jgi:hypothetical protein
VSRHNRTTIAIRRIAQVWSIVAIGFVLLILVGEDFYPSTPARPTPAEWVGLFFFPFGVCVGMILAWRRELLGGGITIASLLAFYAWHYVVRGQLPGGPYFALVAAPGLLFLMLGLLSRSRAALI